MAIEVLLFLVLGYLLLGPTRSVVMARKAGKLMSQFNRAKADLRASVEEELAKSEFCDSSSEPAKK